jgi:hypothetical protein
MDQHLSVPDRLTLLKSDWEWAVKRALFILDES